MKMKILIFIISAIILDAAVDASSLEPKKQPLLGTKECTWGPSYWCQNLTAAATCHATKHCIQTDWIYRQLPPDNSNICQTCLDMVKQARDQLLSNETQDLIKQVFEGSCALIHIKVIVKECDKIVDNFIPDLIDTLASEMNPQVVCSVAGLCNNAKLAKLIEEEEASQSSTLKPVSPKRDQDQCTGCRTVVAIMEQKFNTLSKDKLLQQLLLLCRDAGTLSDACSNIVLTYFTEIYNQIKQHFNPNEVCLLSGACSALFHTHSAPHNRNVQITPTSNIGFVPVDGKDDLPCEFCEQLVKHFRDLLVANTTEEEFKTVMEQLCKQTRSFADECLALVDEYYKVAYNFLVDELNSTVVCKMVGICPGSETMKNIPFVPLLPMETVETLKIGESPKKPALARVPLTKNSPSVQIVSNPARPTGLENMQLPIDILMSPPNQLMFNKQVCQFCQFFLHFVQQAITEPKTEEQIKNIIDKACNDLPSSVNATCVSFVEAYEPALIALLAQEIDPSDICPLIRACPSGEEIHDVDVFMQQDIGDNSKCPLCLFAVQTLEELVKDKRTEADIKGALDKLCSKLPNSLKAECQEFVDTYTEQLVEMLIADLNPQEICVYLKLCTDDKPAPPVMRPVSKPEMPAIDLDSNTIMDNTFNGIIIDVQATSTNVGSIECIICKKVMRLIEKEITDTTNEQAVISFLQNVCKIIPDVDTQDCDNFISKNMDTIVKFLKDDVSPFDVCSLMQLCESPHLNAMKVEIFDCPICEAAVWAMEKVLGNPKVDHEMTHVLEKTCRALPARDQQKCRDIIEKYGSEIYQLLINMTSKSYVCRKIGVCGPGRKVHLENNNDKLTIIF